MIKLKELLNEKQPITKIFLDMDGVVCNFMKQYYNYLSNDQKWMMVMNDKKIVSQAKLDKMRISKSEYIEKGEMIRQQALKSRDNPYELLRDTFKSQLMSNPAWKLIGQGGKDFWSTMDWHPGGKELVAFLKSTNIPIEILTAGAGDIAGVGKRSG